MYIQKGGICCGGIGKTSRLPPYLMYPRFLLDTDLGDTARLVYMLLLDRAKSSIRNPGWEDEQGRVFVFYPIADLARDSRRSKTMVKAALAQLQQKGLIRRERVGVGKANRIFVCVPGPEFRPSLGLFSGHQRVGIPASNKNNKKKNNLSNRSYDYEGEDSL